MRNNADLVTIYDFSIEPVCCLCACYSFFEFGLCVEDVAYCLSWARLRVDHRIACITVNRASADSSLRATMGVVLFVSFCFRHPCGMRSFFEKSCVTQTTKKTKSKKNTVCYAWERGWHLICALKLHTTTTGLDWIGLETIVRELRRPGLTGHSLHHRRANPPVRIKLATPALL